MELTWVQKAQGIGAIAGAISAVLIPLAVAVVAYLLSRRQSRSHELVAARVGYYQTLTPMFNDLVCYMTFIGAWKSFSPPAVIELKRDMDKQFYCAAPLFSVSVSDAYGAFTDLCFKTFNMWGQDALLLTSAYRRRDSHAWPAEWDDYFAYSDDQVITATELESLRKAYDTLVAALVNDLDLTRARRKYTTDAVSLNAHAPQRNDIGPTRT
jgi:hypothetical protein